MAGLIIIFTFVDLEPSLKRNLKAAILEFFLLVLHTMTVVWPTWTAYSLLTRPSMSKRGYDAMLSDPVRFDEFTLYCVQDLCVIDPILYRRVSLVLMPPMPLSPRSKMGILKLIYHDHLVHNARLPARLSPTIWTQLRSTLKHLFSNQQESLSVLPHELISILEQTRSEVSDRMFKKVYAEFVKWKHTPEGKEEKWKLEEESIEDKLGTASVKSVVNVDLNFG